MDGFVVKHKKGCTIFMCAFLVFLGCFSFPVFNTNHEVPKMISLANLYTFVVGYFAVGALAGILYKRSAAKTIAVSAVMTVVGFLCRFMLEYGEVSNVYNFTLPNVALHMAGAVVITAVAAYFNGGD